MTNKAGPVVEWAGTEEVPILRVTTREDRTWPKLGTVCPLPGMSGLRLVSQVCLMVFQGECRVWRVVREYELPPQDASPDHVVTG